MAKKTALELTEQELAKDWVILDGPNLIMRGPGADIVRAFSIMSGVKDGNYVPPTPAELSRYSQKWEGPLALAKVACQMERPRRRIAAAPPPPKKPKVIKEFN